MIELAACPIGSAALALSMAGTAGPAEAREVDLSPGIVACVERLVANDIEAAAGWRGEDRGYTAGGNEISVLRNTRLGQRLLIRRPGFGIGAFTCRVGTMDEADPVFPDWLGGTNAVEIAGVRFDPDGAGRMSGCVNGWTVEIAKDGDPLEDEALVRFVSLNARVAQPGGEC